MSLVALKLPVSTGQAIVRHALRAFVCLLALGILTLASQAKESQYVSRKGLPGYLSQAVKMSEGGTQKAGLIAAAAVAASRPGLPKLAESPLARACAPVAYRVVHFPQALRIRPPPAA